MIQNCIREIITERLITVQEFSHATRIPESTVYRWLKDPRQIPSGDHMHYICLIIQVELGQILVNIPCDLEDYITGEISEETWWKFAAYRARNVIQKRVDCGPSVLFPIKNPRIYPKLDIFKIAARMD